MQCLTLGEGGQSIDLWHRRLRLGVARHVPGTDTSTHHGPAMVACHARRFGEHNHNPAAGHGSERMRRESLPSIQSLPRFHSTTPQSQSICGFCHYRLSAPSQALATICSGKWTRILPHQSRPRRPRKTRRRRSRRAPRRPHRPLQQQQRRLQPLMTPQWRRLRAPRLLVLLPSRWLVSSCTRSYSRRSGRVRPMAITAHSSPGRKTTIVFLP